MKKRINFSTGILFTITFLFAAACSKNNTSAATANTVVIKLNGAQPAIDSVKTSVGINNSVINAINIVAYAGGFYCKIQLYFSPSDPLYAAGAILDFASTHNAGIVYVGSGKSYYDDYMHANHSGTITITKNDAAGRRIEGTLTACVVSTTSGGGTSSITIDGSFAVTYPAQ